MTECVNNALEHGQIAGERGVVRVSLTIDPASRMVTLDVSDNGRGLMRDFDHSQSNSIGLKVVQAFTQQLNGTFSMDGENGTTCRLIFPLPHSTENAGSTQVNTGAS